MWILVLGLVLFIGIHLAKAAAPAWRLQRIAAIGEGRWKGLYSIVSVVGLISIIYGFGLAREEAGQLFIPPEWGRSMLLLIMPVSLVLFIMSDGPVGYIKSTVRHPMLLGIVLWSGAHLLGNGDTASALLFGVFLVWSVFVLIRSYGRPYEPPEKKYWWADAVAIVGSLVLTWLITKWLHEWLIGVPIV